MRERGQYFYRDIRRLACIGRPVRLSVMAAPRPVMTIDRKTSEKGCRLRALARWSCALAQSSNPPNLGCFGDLELEEMQALLLT